MVDGTLDSTFDADGKVATNVGSFDRLLALALQGDGKIAAAGTGHERSAFAVVRYEPDGGLDMTFDEDGMLTTDFGSPVGFLERARVSRSKQTARSSPRASQSWMTISATAQSHATTRTAASTQASERAAGSQPTLATPTARSLSHCRGMAESS